ncbi:Neuropeptide Y receptor type 1 [Trichoplax sp. H2]|nr:Neuropeptide Y receptor type 1 [Trichoplax sp. H2]RDD36623.1 Neuropeptide Y receptor type 1 [Trichoplax sp. H2]|eukprot:RDD36572.1 Neuropeptide Y receptor type 1 [Trichoplax sp. H2]
MAPNITNTSSGQRIAYLTLTSISLLGIFCNGMLLTLILKLKKLKDPSYGFISNLVVSDLITSIQIFILFFVSAISPEIFYLYGTTLCKILYFIYYVSYTVSAFSLALLSIIRYQMVCNPVSFKQNSPICKYLLSTILSVWLISVLFAVPTYLITDYTRFADTCEPSYRYGHIFNIVYFIISIALCYIVPLVIMIACYFIVAMKLCSQVTANSHSQNSSTLRRRSRSIIKLLVLATSLYMLASWPTLASVTALAISHQNLTDIYKYNKNLLYMFQYSFIISYLTCLINPLIFLVLDKSIQSNIRVCFSRKFCCLLRNN